MSTRPYITHRSALLAGLVLALVSGLAASAPEAKAPQRGEYAAFKIISERNIFNPNRSRRSAAGEEESKPSRVDTVTLVGTMSYEKGLYAFFDGSSSEYRKVLEPGKSIAGYTVDEISQNAVKMTAGTNTIELYVGMQLRREGEGDWRVTGRNLTQTTGTSSAAPAETSTSDDSDIVKKLMQQREQELK